jgi:hypothetical protein
MSFVFAKENERGESWKVKSEKLHSLHSIGAMSTTALPESSG